MDALASWRLCMKRMDETTILRAQTTVLLRKLPKTRVDKAIGICKKVVAAFCCSWKKKPDLAAAQEEYDLPKHKFIYETPIRWGSRQQMGKWVLEQKRAKSQEDQATGSYLARCGCFRVHRFSSKPIPQIH
ncbi:zinc finger BED domain-containing protein 4-like [Carassius auratus]|uniref:Zinc finger BED domain-containing protein 4-like n=1 Tax=Carassius auratus TaxID=7957 RepID=A0A6P6Q8K4_CARAU|nr:zinc finger BED domain-containing protein 4-like [Carassius auratus]